MAPSWSQNGEKARKKSQRIKTVGGVPRRRAVLTENGAYMAPTWASKWSQDAQKIDPQIDHVFDASWDRFVDGFWYTLGPKMEPRWHQNGIKNQC